MTTLQQPQKSAASLRSAAEAKPTISQRPVCNGCHMHVPLGRFTRVTLHGRDEYYCGPYHRNSEESCYHKWQVQQAKGDAITIVNLFGSYGFFNQETVDRYAIRIKNVASFTAMEAVVSELVNKLRTIYETSAATLETIKNNISKHFQRLLEVLGLSYRKDELEDLGFVF